MNTFQRCKKQPEQSTSLYIARCVCRTVNTAAEYMQGVR